MPFIRVRGATPGDPLHEFDVTVDEARRHPDLYEVLDGKPVAQQRSASLIPGIRPGEGSPAGDPPAPSRKATQNKRPARAKKEES